MSLDADGVTELALARLEWVAGAEVLRCRVGVIPSLTDAAANTLKAWWGNPSAAMPAAADPNGQYAAFDASWAGYWPLESNVADWTANGHNLTTEGTWTYSAGKVGSAPDAQAVTGNLAYRNAAPVAGDPLTLIGWIYATSDSVNCDYVNISSLKGGSSTGTDNTIGLARMAASTALRATTRKAGTVYSALTGTTRNTWWFSAGQFADGGASRVVTRNATIGTPETTDKDVVSQAWVNIRCDYCRPSHIQAHSVVRSDAWIATEYNATNDPASFCVMGVVEDLSGPTYVDLAGAIAGVSSLGGSLTRVAQLTGSIDGAATLSGTLQRVAQLAGAIEAAATFEGGLTRVAQLAGGISGNATLAGTLTRVAQLAGSLAGSASLSADLRMAIRLAGNIAGQAVLSGTLTTAERTMLLKAVLEIRSRLGAMVDVESRLAAGLSVGARFDGKVMVN